MSTKWPEATIGEVCQLHTGGTPSRAKPEFFENGDIPWLVSGDVNRTEILECEGRITEAGLSSSNAKFLPLNSVVIALAGQGKTRGTVALLRIKATCNQSVVAISPNSQDQLLPEYLFWNLKGRYQEIRRMSGDDERDRRGLNMAQIRSIRIPLPPLDEQKRIVAKLDEALADLDQVSSNTKGSLEKIDALWSSYLSEVFYSTSNSTEKPTESTWTSEKLQNVCAFFTDGNWIESKDQSDEGYRLIQTGNVGEGIYKFNDHRARYVSKVTFEKLKCTEVFPGDVLISRLPDPIGRACRVPEMLEPCITGVDCTILRFKDDVIPDLFVYFSQTSNYLDAVKKMAGGTTRQRISRKNLGEIEFPVPPIEDQKQIITRLDAQQKLLEEMRNVKRKTLRESEQLRSSILAAAFAGDF